MKILWHSTSPLSTSSYSVLTARAVPGLVADGHQVALGTWYGLQGMPIKWGIKDHDTGEVIKTIDIFPSGDGPNFSQDILNGLYQYVNAEALILCSDVWPFEPKVTRSMNFCPWLPVDMDPAPPPVLKALGPAMYPMVYSQWGVDVLEQAGVKAHYVPCGADSRVFRPGDKKAARDAAGIIEGTDFVVSMVAANKDPNDRKGLIPALQGFAEYAKENDNAYFYLHTNWGGAIPIEPIVDSLGISGKVIQPPPLGYKLGLLDTAYMVRIYQASDVLLNPSKSEGFGLPILEAQLCGTPVIATDYSTTDELLWAGWKVGGRRDWATGLDSWRIAVDPAQITDALREAYKSRNNKTLQTQARRGALSLDTKRVHETYWRPALADIERLVTTAQKIVDMNPGKPQPEPQPQPMEAAHVA
jgi:glycosyltransferase involved in cell wall biosynthesis